MASIQTGIELHDGFTNVMYGIIESVYSANYAMYDFQDAMNEAVDVSPYDQISNDIEEATRQQDNFNREINEGISHSNDLIDSIKGIAAAYASIQTVEQVIELSDTMAQTTARLDLIVNDGGSVEELQNQIFASAQNARGSYLATADAVSKLGMQAGDAFSSNDELIAFTELLNKQFVNAGTSAQGINSVMLQLTQSMAAGKLQGEELNAVLDNAAPIVQDIQRYLEEVQGVDASNIKELASEGVLTADVIKSAMFYAADEINAKFDSMPMTWGQVWNSMQNSALVAFQPVLQEINDLANSNAFQSFANGAIEAMAILANVVLWVFELVATVGGFIADNWSIISPIVYGVVAALALYAGYLAVVKAAELIGTAVKIAMCVASYAHAAATGAEASATAAATAAQYGLNTALLSCPLVWIIMLVIALIAVIIMLCNWIAEVTGAANSGIGIIVGALSVAVAFIGNIFVALINMVIDIFVTLWNFIAAFVNFFGNVFTDPVGAIARLFFDLVDCILGLLQTLAGAIDALFGSDLAGAVQGWRDDLGGWVDETFGQGEEIMATVSGEEWHVDRFEYGEAWDAGVAVGDGISSAIDDFSFSDIFGSTEIPNAQDYTAQFAGMNDSLEGISGDTSNISDAMDITQEELKYMRDLAEQESVNRYTTADVTIHQTNNNNINNGMDLDGIVTALTDMVDESVEIVVGKGD